MPFGFGRKRDESGPALPSAAPPVARTIRFQGFTEEWRLEGQVEVTGRLLDLLNLREVIAVHDVSWAPHDGSAALEPAPGIKSIDPYDLIIVLAGARSLTAVTDEERSAHRIHKVTYDVAMTAPPFRIVGSIQLHPGTVPESLLDRGSLMFAAVTDPAVALGESTIDLGGAEAVLVNRFYLRGIEQVDKSTGQPWGAVPSA